MRLVKPTDEIRRYLAGVVGCIEATNEEKHGIWERNKNISKLPWVDTGMGYGHHIGDVDNRPIAISLLTTTIDGELYLFYHGTSELVDHKMIREWLEQYMPVTAFRDNDPRLGLNHADATNWINAVRRRPKVVP
jgi:hypothetical protein